MLSPNRIEPRIEHRRITPGFVEMTARATVNKHEPEIVVYIIEAGAKYFVSENRTGIGGLISGHRRMDIAERKALAIVGQRFRETERNAKKRVNLYG